MGNRQVSPAPSSSSDAEEVTQFLCARIPRLECYTTKEPTFKDCFTARESWANLTKEKSRSYPPSPTHAEAEKAREEKAKGEEKAKEEKEEKGEEEGVKAEEEGVKAEEEGDIKEELTPDSDTSGDMAFFSLFFKKLETLHPESKLIPASAEGGYLLDSLISILLMGATSVHAVEKFLEKYSYVGLSECKQPQLEHIIIHGILLLCTCYHPNSHILSHKPAHMDLRARAFIITYLLVYPFLHPHLHPYTPTYTPTPIPTQTPILTPIHQYHRWIHRRGTDTNPGCHNISEL
ncbi:hypothetical protein B484DRAFT_2050 [Ochromonadaceae sp. CCMP2298]|nr:hypothetical protein B484DRAFT_2050 [Ochromonadaceae sp. CCMP2298]